MLGEMLVTKGLGGMNITNDGTKTTILGTTGDYNRIGDAATTNHSLDSEDDLMVTGELEVDGAIFFDGILSTHGHIYSYATIAYKTSVGIFDANNADNSYITFRCKDNATAFVEVGGTFSAADPYWMFGRDDTGVALNAITDGLVLRMGGGTGNEAQGQGFGMAFNIGNASSEVEKRGAINCYLQTATNAAEDSQLHFWTMLAGTLNQAFKVDEAGIGYFDAAGAGDAIPTLFDHLDDALVIREGLRNRELLTDIGVMERKDTGSGYFMKVQPMLNLLGGGIYQNRARIDDIVEVLASEFPQVANKLITRNLLTQGRN